MPNFQAWKIIGYVEIFYYFAAAIAAVHFIYKLITHKLKFGKLATFFLSLLVLTKITSGILSVVLLSSSNGNISLAIAFVVLNSVGIGLFLSLLLRFGNFINIVHRVDDVESSIGTEKYYTSSPRSARKPPRLLIFRLVYWIGDRIEKPSSSLHSVNSSRSQDQNQNRNQAGFEFPLLERVARYFTTICIVLMAVGGGLTGGGGNTVKAGRTILKIGSILYLISVLSVLAMLTHKLIVYQRSKKTYQIGFALVLLLLSTPLLLIRIVYTTCASFEFTVYYGPTASKFTMFYGSWRYYLGMSFIEECIAMLLLLTAGEIIVHRIR